MYSFFLPSLHDHDVSSLISHFIDIVNIRRRISAALEEFAYIQSINQSIIYLTRCVEELKNSFKIRTCINKIYNDY